MRQLVRQSPYRCNSPIQIYGGGVAIGYHRGGCSWSAFAPALFCGRIFTMQIEVLEKQVKLLRILVDGCKKHPAYRAIRPATGRCKPCVKMWKARQELEALNK